MAETGGHTCEICLRQGDLTVMLTVAIAHSVPVSGRKLVLCRDCAIAIDTAALNSDVLAPYEVRRNALTRAANPGDSGPAAPAPAAADPLVPGAQQDDEGPGEHRREPELPADRKRGKGSKE